MGELRLEPTPKHSGSKLVHFPLCQATKNSPPYPKPGQLSLFLTLLINTTISLVKWTKFLGVCLDTSWYLITAHVPFVTYFCLFHLWNITEIHPLLFISTTMILVQVDILFPWTPLLGSCLVHPWIDQTPLWSILQVAASVAFAKDKCHLLLKTP